MSFPAAEELTSTEWQTIIFVERLRGLSKKDIMKLLDCKESVIEPHWSVFREDGMEYLQNSRSVRRALKHRVYRYMDNAFREKEILCTPGLLADVLGGEEDEVARLIESWREDVSTCKHFPVCTMCKFRGDKWNPIMENGACLECNAEMYGWPLDVWKEDGRYIALLYSFGLIPAKDVAQRIREKVDDLRDGTETHRQRAQQQYVAGGA